jgi:hypothetical protein
MTLSLPNPFSFAVKQPQPIFKSSLAEKKPQLMFKSVRTAGPVAKSVVKAKAKPAKATAPQKILPEFESAKPDTWYDKKSGFEMFLDMFWSRRNVIGEIRSRRDYHRVLRWQAAAALPLFPPIGATMILANMIFGLRPKTTRIAFIASCALAALVISNAMIAADPIALAALR